MKLQLPYMKKKTSRIVGDTASNMKAAQNSKMEDVAGSVKEKKIFEKTGRPDEADKERKCKHCDGTKHLHCHKSQHSKALVKDNLKKHKMVDVNPDQVQQDMHTKKLDHVSDLLKDHSVPDPSDTVKKRKLGDTDRKLDETLVDSKLYEVDGQSKGSSRKLQHFIKKEQTENSDKVQSVERRQKSDEKFVSKSNTEVKTKISGTEDRNDSKAGVDKPCVDSKASIDSMAGVDKHCVDRKNGHSKDSARQHVRHGLYRALSSR